MKKTIFSILSTLLIIFLLGCSKSTSVTTGATPTVSTIQFNGNNFANNGVYPKLYTCDSLGISPALKWTNAPAATLSYAITMHHIPPTGDKHVYLVLYNIPSTTTSIPENSKTIGVFGINTVDGKTSYTPPCSQGPGAKIYVLTVYALSGAPVISVPSAQVTMDILLAGMKGKILDSTSMSVTYTRP
jgi:phosphatidylethanolamine-binding protein (PEBP) family uncharacterized protein